MFWTNPKLQATYYKFLHKLYSFDDKIKFFPIDLKKPWYNIFLLKRYTFVLVFFSEVFQSVFDALFPLIIGYSLSIGDFKILLIAIGVYLLTEIINRFALYYYNLALAQLHGSLMKVAQDFFLTVDPISHSTKSTG
jgi:hypothetical protein